MFAAMRRNASEFLLFLIALNVCAGSTAAQPPTPGDDRSGYESPGFVTRTQRINASQPRDAALARTAAQGTLGLPVLAQPPDQALIDLGRRLFFDRRLSANDTLSCGMCHIPEQAFTQNELATPVGIRGALVLRNAPSLYNIAFRRVLFHDGRETRLAEQIWAPLLAANEMGNSGREQVLSRIRQLPGYVEAFDRLFAGGLTAESLGAALAAYQRALLSANSAFDRWYYGHEPQALSPQAQQGFAIFASSGCADCHLLGTDSALFTDDDFHNTGTGIAAAQRNTSKPSQVQLAPGVFVPLNTEFGMPDRTDTGRETVSGDPADRWKFRTPSLRNVALSAPYMHDGSLSTLADVIGFYNQGGGGDPAQDPRIRPLQLTPAQQQALLAFLLSLTSDNVQALAADARTAAIGER